MIDLDKFKKAKNTYTEEDISKPGMSMTVGQLKKFIEMHEMDDDCIIMVERVHDYYFLEGSWKTLRKDGDFSHWARDYNEKITNGEFLDKERYPSMDDENRSKLITEEEIAEGMDEFLRIEAPTIFDNDKRVLFLKCHY